MIAASLPPPAATLSVYNGGDHTFTRVIRVIRTYIFLHFFVVSEF